jgi:hypothetical protein
MNYRRMCLRSIVTIAAFATILFVVSCGDPYAPIRVVNQTGQTLTVIVNERNVGEVEPGKELRNKIVILGYSRYAIQARYPNGQLAYSSEFSYEQMKKIGWKILIE